MAKKAAMRGFWIQETDEVGWMIFRVSGKREGFSGKPEKKGTTVGLGVGW